MDAGRRGRSWAHSEPATVRGVGLLAQPRGGARLCRVPLRRRGEDTGWVVVVVNRTMPTAGACSTVMAGTGGLARTSVHRVWSWEGGRVPGPWSAFSTPREWSDRSRSRTEDASVGAISSTQSGPATTRRTSRPPQIISKGYRLYLQVSTNAPVSRSSGTVLYLIRVSEDAVIEPTLLKPGLTPALDATPPPWGRRQGAGRSPDVLPGLQ